MLNIQRRRRVAIGLAVTLLLIVELLAWWYPEQTADVTVPTGASFNLAVGRFHDPNEARAVAATIEASGLPAFTRGLRNGTIREVIVGPYVSLDEAEDAQRDLRRRGFGRARMLVDESIRRAMAAAVGTSLVVPAPNMGLVAVSAAGRVSIVLELSGEPRRVLSRRGAQNVLEVDVGPIAGGGRPAGLREWMAPAGVELFERVSVEEPAGAYTGVIRTRVTTPALVQGRVRTVGRRVYIDLWSPQSIADIPVTARRSMPAVDDEDEADEPVPDRVSVESYREALRPAVVRFTEIEPFLLAAVAAPSPDVMTALGRTVNGVAEWIRTIEAPAESGTKHASLTAAVDLAAASLDPAFEGDRAAQARQAIALFTPLGRELLPE